MKKYIVLRRFEEKNLGKLQPYDKLQFFCDNHSTAFIQIRELITEPPTYTQVETNIIKSSHFYRKMTTSSSLFK